MNTPSITATLTYLIGADPSSVPPQLYRDLEEMVAAKVIRSLSIIRNTLLLQNGAISNHIRYNLYANIDEFVDADVLDFLESQGIQLIKPRPRVNEYISTLNRLIPERMEACRELFSDWLEFGYIRRLFTMNDASIEDVVNDIHMRKRSYPFGCYLNWPIRNPKAYPNGRTIGNVLEDEQTFLRLLYAINNAVLTEPKNDLRRFLDEAGRAVLAVDCENSDPFKLCAALHALSQDALNKIEKTILFDDIHTVDTWRLVGHLLPVPVEHIMTQRVNDHKSLVDIQLTAGVAKEHYGEGVDSFLLASSDSDYWGLIRSLPTARFMVLLQAEKTGEGMRRALDESNIGYYAIDQVDTGAVKRAALDAGVRNRLAEIRVDVKKMIVETLNQTDLTEQEKIDYFKTLQGRIKVGMKDGVVTTELLPAAE